MLPKEYRLPVANFKDLKKNGRILHAPLFSILIKKNDLKNLRLGIIVSTKVSKLATERNRIKRCVRDYFHKMIKNEFPYDVLFLAKSSMVKKDFEEISSDLSKVIDKLDR